MTKAFRFTIITMLLGAATLLSACSGKPSTEDAINVITDDLNASHPSDLCWAPASLAGLTFPVNVLMSEQTPRDHGILDGLNRSGLATVQMQVDPNNPSAAVLHIDLTDKGKAAHVWDPKRGFCVGRPRVEDITSMREDPAQKGAYDVYYTWTFDAPSWVEREKFPKLRGMAIPAPGDATITRTSDWSKTDVPWHIL